MNESLIHNANIYALRHQLSLAETLGFGVHGVIFVAEDKSKTGMTGKFALKAHRSAEPYRREREIYEHLKQAQVTQIAGFSVPQALGFDNELLVILMTIVTRPFVLDFAGAYLYEPPEFSEEILAEAEAERRERFEDRWPKVEEVLAALRALDIHMVDVSPNNIAFQDPP
jgi:hypothetical protein